MATSKKTLRDNLRTAFLDKVVEALKNAGEEVLVTGSNEIAIPTLDAEGNDEYIVVTVKVPTGSRDGDAYDGYAMAEEYRLKLAEKAEKAKKAAESKAKKIAKDKAEREAKAKAKALREGGDDTNGEVQALPGEITV